MPILALTGSVGTGKAKGSAPHNAPADVILVRDRLIVTVHSPPGNG